jgi:nucleotide-binding universal stress UspA family protein
MAVRPLERVLVATDFSPAAENAVAHAGLIAEKAGALLHVVHVVAAPLPSVNEPHERWVTADERLAARRMREMQPRPSVATVTALLHHTDAAPAIVDYAYDRDLDLVLLGCQGLTARGRLGNVAQQVVRLCPVSVMLAGNGAAHRLRTQHYQTILAAVDFTAASRHALREAASLCRQHGASLVVAHIVDQPEAPPAFTGVDSRVLPAHGDTTLRAYAALEDLTAGLRASKLVIAEGSVHSRLHDLAHEVRADLIVMGAAGVCALDRFLVGSVAERLLREAPIPVLIARTRESIAL